MILDRNRHQISDLTDGLEALTTEVRSMASAVGASEAEVEVADAASRIVTSVEGQQAVVPVLGTRAVLRFRLDLVEDDRRRRAHSGAIRSPEVLDLLLGLPVGVPVPIGSLTPSERSALRVAPPGVVTVDAACVTRQAVYPLAVDLAVVASRGWRTGLEVVGRFAPFCARVMLLRQWPDDAENLRMQADFYGIGVVIAHGTDVEILVAPHLFQRRRFTAAGWQFIEEVYQHVR